VKNNFKLSQMLAACLAIYLATLPLVTTHAKSEPLFEIVTFTQSLQFYQNLPQIPTNPPSYMDANINVPIVNYIGDGYYQGSGYLIDTSTLQSVIIQDTNVTPPDGPLITLGGISVDATVYDGYTYSGPDPAGTVLYQNTPPSSPSLYVTGPSLGGPLSNSKMPTSITAAATISTVPIPNSVPILTLPSGVTTLQEAAKDTGYSGFDWVQQVTVPTPSPYYECSNSACSSLINISGFYSDPPEYGYSYCNPNNTNLSHPYDSTEGACVNNYPYYYPLTDVASSTLDFYDAPADTCLFALLSTDNGCGGAAAFLPLVFTTELVGITENGPDDLFDFSWTDSFNGTSLGGISTTFNDQPVDPGSGAGGITLVAINGVPVPEPTSLGLLAAGFFGLIVAIRSHHSKRADRETRLG
jgi:hypothetical protein